MTKKEALKMAQAFVGDVYGGQWDYHYSAPYVITEPYFCTQTIDVPPGYTYAGARQHRARTVGELAYRLYADDTADYDADSYATANQESREATTASDVFDIYVKHSKMTG